MSDEFYDDLYDMAVHQKVYLGKGYSSIVVRSGLKEWQNFTQNVERLKSQIKAYKIMKEMGYRVPEQLSKIKVLKSSNGKNISYAEFEYIEGLSIKDIWFNPEINMPSGWLDVLKHQHIDWVKRYLNSEMLVLDEITLYQDMIFTGDINDLKKMLAAGVETLTVRAYLRENITWLDPVY